MKQFIFVGLLVSCLAPSILCAQEMQETKDPKTQTEITGNTCAELHKTEKKLDGVYKEITEKYSNDAVFLKYLDASQQAWVNYRNAEIKALYPTEYHAAYGSSLKMCECNQLNRMTQERVKELKQWLDGTKQGNVCAGSIRLKTGIKE